MSKLLAAGMNCARVNTAHDSADVWARIIATVQRCAEDAGKECRIFMDLAGPKLRRADHIFQLPLQFPRL